MQPFTIPETSQSEEIQRKQKEEHVTAILATLPKENGWSSSDDHPLYYFQGFWYQGFYIGGLVTLPELPGFNPSPSDIIVCSTLKSGTTWLKALTFAIATRTRFADCPEENPLLTTIPHDLIPSIEFHVAQMHEPRDPNLPLFCTHIPYTSLPTSIFASGCKIVYIWRDPKDVFVSTLHFANKIRPNKEVTKPITLEEAFDLFCRGISFHGPYWNHVLVYWKAYLNHPDKMLFLKYEDMMSDPELYVKRLAKFMQFPFSEEEEKEGIVARIIEICSFESLNKVNKTGTFTTIGPITISKDSFFRKGKIGDWKNHLTEEMANRIDQITAEKFGNSGLVF